MTDFNSLLDIQKNMASRLSQEIHMTQTVELLSLIQSLVSDKFGRVQKELIIVEAQHMGLSETETLALLQELISQGTLRSDGEYILL